MPSVNDFVKRINASEKFLISIAALPTYKDIESLQYKKLDDFLSSCKWGEEEVAHAVTAMQLVTKFSESSKKKILTKLASLCCEKEKAKPRKGPSSAAQDYSSLHRFIPGTLWKDLTCKDVLQRTHSLCKHGASLGLCQPTELTLRTMICCVFWTSWSLGTTPPGEKYRLGQGLKPTIRHVLKEYSGEAGPLRLDKLPTTFEDLPATHVFIFDNEKPTPATLKLEECIRTFPLRRTASGVNSTSSNDLLQMVVQMVNEKNSVATTAKPALQAAQPVLALEDGKMEDSQESLPGTNPQLALQDQIDSQPVAETAEDMEVKVKKAEMKQQALKTEMKPKRKISEVLGDLKKAFVKDNAQRKERRVQDEAEPEKPAGMESKADKPQETAKSTDSGKGDQKKKESKKESNVEAKKKSLLRKMRKRKRRKCFLRRKVNR